MWRLTQDERYRQYAWELVKAIYRHFRVEESGGLCHVYCDRESNNPDQLLRVDFQYPCHLSDTLKYLYLIFDDSNVLPLNKWIFHSFGQPLPIIGEL